MENQTIRDIENTPYICTRLSNKIKEVMYNERNKSHTFYLDDYAASRCESAFQALSNCLSLTVRDHPTTKPSRWGEALQCYALNETSKGKVTTVVILHKPNDAASYLSAKRYDDYLSQSSES